MATEYSKDFFEMIRAGCERSAKEVAPLVYSLIKPRSVVDVGCGQGWWGAAFADLGAEVVGVDGDYVTDPVVDLRHHDLTAPLPDLGTFDLAVCLEVAEHLPAPVAGQLIDDLCRLAPFVLFSAAIPKQGGVGHLNEQWPAYWVDHFHRNGFECSGDLRWEIWQNPDVEPWYCQNLILAGKSLPSHMDNRVPPIAHPTIWEHRVQ